MVIYLYIMKSSLNDDGWVVGDVDMNLPLILEISSWSEYLPLSDTLWWGYNVGVIPIVNGVFTDPHSKDAKWESPSSNMPQSIHGGLGTQFPEGW